MYVCVRLCVVCECGVCVFLDVICVLMVIVCVCVVCTWMMLSIIPLVQWQHAMPLQRQMKGGTRSKMQQWLLLRKNGLQNAGKA